MNKATVLMGIAALVTGLGLGYLLFGGNTAQMSASTSEQKQPLFYRSPMNPEVTSPVPAQDAMGMDYVPVYAQKSTEAERKILFYRNPMNPAVTSPVPAKDAMGMDYVPVYAEAAIGSVEGTVKIDPVIQHNIGVRTATAQRRAFSRTIRAVGRVDYDEEKMIRLHPKIDGWIRDLFVDKTGQPVAMDDILLSIYSPKLVSTQQEYLLALNHLHSMKDSSVNDIRQGAEALANSSRQRLVLMDVPEHQIRELEKTRVIKESLHIHAPARGTVLRIGARQGQYVSPATELYMIVDLGKVWVYADVYEYELPWVKVGDRVEMTLASVPGRTFTGELAYIYPYAESKTRTTKIRLVFDNSDRLLRPEMFSEVSIFADEKLDQIVVPSEAVVRSGDYNQIFVKTGPGTFEPRKVKLGVESGGLVAVSEGVQAGEEVVTSAQFLIDSESKLREATAKMMQPKQDAAAGAQVDKPSEIGAKHAEHEAMDSGNGDMNHD